jgi:hypothetical protein
LEELVAYWLAVNLPDDAEVWVDQPIRFEGVNRIAWYFDLTVVRTGIIRGILDIKADIGWMRSEFGEFCRRHRDRVHRIRGRVGQLRDRMQGGHRSVQVSDGCCHHLVIVSGENISSAAREIALRDAKHCEPELFVYVLSEGMSLNSVTPDLSRLQVNDDAFDLLLRRLRQ